MNWFKRTSEGIPGNAEEISVCLDTLRDIYVGLQMNVDRLRDMLPKGQPMVKEDAFQDSGIVPDAVITEQTSLPR